MISDEKTLAKLASLGEEYLELVDEIKEKEERRIRIKEEVDAILKANEVGYAFVPVGDTEQFIFKNHSRATKCFDKDKLASKISEDRDTLDYAGIAKLTEKGKITSTQVQEFLHTNKSEFVTVRLVAIKKKKNKGESRG
jgi:hypothetical protein